MSRRAFPLCRRGLSSLSRDERIPGQGTAQRVARPPRPQATLRSGRDQQPIGKVRKPGLLRAQTSLPIFFLFWKKPRAFRVGETTSGNFYLFPLPSAAQALRALRVPSVPGHQRKARGPSPTAPPTRALVVLGRAPLLHMRHYVICPRRTPVPVRFRLLERPREFEQVLQRHLL